MRASTKAKVLESGGAVQSYQQMMQDEHRLFVQVMMSRRILTKEDAKEIVEEKLSSAGLSLIY